MEPDGDDILHREAPWVDLLLRMSSSRGGGVDEMEDLLNEASASLPRPDRVRVGMAPLLPTFSDFLPVRAARAGEPKDADLDAVSTSASESRSIDRQLRSLRSDRDDTPGFYNNLGESVEDDEDEDEYEDEDEDEYENEEHPYDDDEQQSYVEDDDDDDERHVVQQLPRRGSLGSHSLSTRSSSNSLQRPKQQQQHLFTRSLTHAFQRASHVVASPPPQTPPRPMTPPTRPMTTPPPPPRAKPSAAAPVKPPRPHSHSHSHSPPPPAPPRTLRRQHVTVEQRRSSVSNPTQTESAPSDVAQRATAVPHVVRVMGDAVAAAMRRRVQLLQLARDMELYGLGVFNEQALQRVRHEAEHALDEIDAVLQRNGVRNAAFMQSVMLYASLIARREVLSAASENGLIAPRSELLKYFVDVQSDNEQRLRAACARV